MDRVNLTEAARILEISEGAVRKRHKRGKLRGETGVDGRLYVWVDKVDSEGASEPAEDGPLIEELRDRVRSLERQLEEANTANREHRRLLARALERIPELEAPDAASGEQNRPDSGLRGASEGASTPESSQAHSEAPRSWLRRWLGR